MIYFFTEFWDECEKWSDQTFGPREVRGPKGPIEHLKKEIIEIEKSDYKDINEFVDAFFLILDAVRRAGFSRSYFMQKCWEKLVENKRRTWPDWRTMDPNKAIEHNRITPNTKVVCGHPKENSSRFCSRLPGHESYHSDGEFVWDRDPITDNHANGDNP